MVGGYRLGVDIGGTFTDVVLTAPDGAISVRKVPSTPDDYSRGILDGVGQLLAELGLPGSALAEVIHGTTVATNAILEYKGAKTALLTTRGFRDVLELRRVRAPELYNARYAPPKPLVERRLRLEIDERIGPGGEVLRPLDEESVWRAVERIRAEGVEAVAVTFLHSYHNDAHERRAGEIVRRALPGVYLSLSVDVLPEIREYERTSTTVINAAVGPIVQAYLQALRRRLDAAGVGAPLLIMQSNGGIMGVEAAVERPAQIVESGPAAGVIAGHRLSERTGQRNLITFDMGGTTAKASLIEDGRLTQTTEYEVGAGISLSSRLVKGGGHALKLPVLDIAEVGAGGGSIVWIDRGGALRVGPHSAGAVPGPACYATGGEEATVTDANVVLGYLNPRELAGGAIELAPERAEEALGRIARALGVGPLEAAYGVYTVANATMIRAVKAVSTYRGRDPRDFALLAFGGNGGVFAAELARALDIRRALVPPAAGLFSAFGLLEADLEHHVVQTFVAHADEIDPDALNRAFLDLGSRAVQALSRVSGQDRPVTVQRLADLRYSGQAYELTVPVPPGSLGPEDVADLVERFGAEHERTYAHRAERAPVELVNLRVVARVERDQASDRQDAKGARTVAEVVRSMEQLGAAGWRLAYFGPQHGLLETPVLLDRAALAVRQRGPLIVEEYDATTVVPPGCVAGLDELGNIVIEVE